MPTPQEFTGPIIFIGYGSIARGVLALIERHLKFDSNQVTIIEPKESQMAVGTGNQYRHLHLGLTPDNYIDVLDGIVHESTEQALLINLSVEVSSVALMKYAHSRNALYIDTVVEPWPGVYDDLSKPAHERTNYHLREEMLALRDKLGNTGTSALSCCGANPGMVSWLTKKALLKIAADVGHVITVPSTREEWAELANALGVLGIHIAERDNQTTQRATDTSEFLNTWSVEGLISEAQQPAELGWGTHELSFPEDGHRHEKQTACGIYLDTRGAETKVKTWVPTHGAIEAFLVTHNEALSLSEYLTIIDENGDVVYRPTVHYAYHPCDTTVSCLERLMSQGISDFEKFHVLTEHEITSGHDELGVLLYGHAKNAYWYGSRLSTAKAKELAPHQNATGLQVTSAVLAGICWLLENRDRGIVEVEEIDHELCLAIQEPYLGTIFGEYTDWVPTQNNEDPIACWQFSNIRINNNN